MVLLLKIPKRFDSQFASISSLNCHIVVRNILLHFQFTPSVYTFSFHHYFPYNFHFATKQKNLSSLASIHYLCQMNSFLQYIGY